MIRINKFISKAITTKVLVVEALNDAIYAALTIMIHGYLSVSGYCGPLGRFAEILLKSFQVTPPSVSLISYNNRYTDFTMMHAYSISSYHHP